MYNLNDIILTWDDIFIKNSKDKNIFMCFMEFKTNVSTTIKTTLLVSLYPEKAKISKGDHSTNLLKKIIKIFEELKLIIIGTSCDNSPYFNLVDLHTLHFTDFTHLKARAIVNLQKKKQKLNSPQLIIIKSNTMQHMMIFLIMYIFTI